MSSVTGDCLIRVDSQEYDHRMSGIILRQMKQEAEEDFIRLFVVITVPAYLDDRMRNATQEADVCRARRPQIINEPTAAALAYAGKLGFSRQRKRVAVYDFAEVRLIFPS